MIPPELVAELRYADRAAECERSGHTWVAWDAPKLGMLKDLCTNCGVTESLHGDTDHTPAAEASRH